MGASRIGHTDACSLGTPPPVSPHSEPQLTLLPQDPLQDPRVDLAQAPVEAPLCPGSQCLGERVCTVQDSSPFARPEELLHASPSGLQSQTPWGLLWTPDPRSSVGPGVLAAVGEPPWQELSQCVPPTRQMQAMDASQKQPSSCPAVASLSLVENCLFLGSSLLTFLSVVQQLVAFFGVFAGGGELVILPPPPQLLSDVNLHFKAAA